MKHRWLVVLPTLALLAASTVACGSGGTSSSTATSGGKVGGTLVVYTPNEQTMLDALMPAFKAATGIDYQLVTAATGELYTRIKSEAGNPQGDVLFGGGVAQAMANPDLWEKYTAAHDSEMTDLGKNVGGFSTPYQADGSCLLVNKDKVGSITIKGYADLLNPELKGKIAFGDPANSSSAFAQLTNMLAAMGGQSTMDANYTSDAAWAYVKSFLQQINGKLIGSSSAVAQGAAQGEYVVAATYEAQAMNQVGAGMPVNVVYMSEGSVYLPSGVEIIKGAKNMAQAKAFADWIQSKEAQQILADKTNGRPLRGDLTLRAGMTPLADIKQLTEDSKYVSEHRSEIVKKFQDILATVG